METDLQLINTGIKIVSYLIKWKTNSLCHSWNTSLSSFISSSIYSISLGYCHTKIIKEKYKKIFFNVLEPIVSGAVLNFINMKLGSVVFKNVIYYIKETSYINNQLIHHIYSTKSGKTTFNFDPEKLYGSQISTDVNFSLKHLTTIGQIGCTYGAPMLGEHVKKIVNNSLIYPYAATPDELSSVISAMPEVPVFHVPENTKKIPHSHMKFFTDRLRSNVESLDFSDARVKLVGPKISKTEYENLKENTKNLHCCFLHPSFTDKKRNLENTLTINRQLKLKSKKLAALYESYELSIDTLAKTNIMKAKDLNFSRKNLEILEQETEIAKLEKSILDLEELKIINDTEESVSTSIGCTKGVEACEDKADIVIMFDSIYDVNLEGLLKTGHDIGAHTMYAVVILPFGLLYVNSYTSDELKVRFERHGEGFIMTHTSDMTLGYVHSSSTVMTLMKQRVYQVEGSTWMMEIVNDIAEMCLCKFTKISSLTNVVTRRVPPKFDDMVLIPDPFKFFQKYPVIEYIMVSNTKLVSASCAVSRSKVTSDETKVKDALGHVQTLFYKISVGTFELQSGSEISVQEISAIVLYALIEGTCMFDKILSIFKQTKRDKSYFQRAVNFLTSIITSEFPNISNFLSENHIESFLNSKIYLKDVVLKDFVDVRSTISVEDHIFDKIAEASVNIFFDMNPFILKDIEYKKLGASLLSINKSMISTIKAHGYSALDLIKNLKNLTTSSSSRRFSMSQDDTEIFNIMIEDSSSDESDIIILSSVDLTSTSSSSRSSFSNDDEEEEEESINYIGIEIPYEYEIKTSDTRGFKKNILQVSEESSSQFRNSRIVSEKFSVDQDGSLNSEEVFKKISSIEQELEDVDYLRLSYEKRMVIEEKIKDIEELKKALKKKTDSDEKEKEKEKIGEFEKIIENSKKPDPPISSVITNLNPSTTSESSTTQLFGISQLSSSALKFNTSRIVDGNIVQLSPSEIKLAVKNFSSEGSIVNPIFKKEEILKEWKSLSTEYGIDAAVLGELGKVELESLKKYIKKLSANLVEIGSTDKLSSRKIKVVNGFAGSGKTFDIVQEFNGYKDVYICPIKSVVLETHKELKEKFKKEKIEPHVYTYERLSKLPLTGRYFYIDESSALTLGFLTMLLETYDYEMFIIIGDERQTKAVSAIGLQSTSSTFTSLVKPKDVFRKFYTFRNGPSAAALMNYTLDYPVFSLANHDTKIIINDIENTQSYKDETNISVVSKPKQFRSIFSNMNTCKASQGLTVNKASVYLHIDDINAINAFSENAIVGFSRAKYELNLYVDYKSKQKKLVKNLMEFSTNYSGLFDVVLNDSDFVETD